MNATDFVDAIRTEVRDAAVSDVMSLIEHPPGRRPSPALVSLSQWFNGLSDADKQQIRRAVEMASNHATFGFLAVLDGARSIENSTDRGAIELHFVKSNQSVLLNNPKGKALHELMQHPELT